MDLYASPMVRDRARLIAEFTRTARRLDRLLVLLFLTAMLGAAGGLLASLGVELAAAWALFAALAMVLPTVWAGSKAVLTLFRLRRNLRAIAREEAEVFGIPWCHWRDYPPLQVPKYHAMRRGGGDGGSGRKGDALSYLRGPVVSNLPSNVIAVRVARGRRDIEDPQP